MCNSCGGCRGDTNLCVIVVVIVGVIQIYVYTVVVVVGVIQIYV